MKEGVLDYRLLSSAIGYSFRLPLTHLLSLFKLKSSADILGCRDADVICLPVESSEDEGVEKWI